MCSNWGKKHGFKTGFFPQKILFLQRSEVHRLKSSGGFSKSANAKQKGERASFNGKSPEQGFQKPQVWS